MELTITDSNFAEVIKSDKLVMIDFWAVWCGPCQMLSPVVAAVAEEYDGKLVVGKCNVDECDVVPAKLGIMSIPALFFFKNGQIVAKTVGYRGKDELKAQIDSLL